MVAATEDEMNGNRGILAADELAKSAHQINFDELSSNELRRHASALADRYKLLLEECDTENGWLDFDYGLIFLLIEK